MVTQLTTRADGLLRFGPAASVDPWLSCCAEVSSELLDEDGQVLDSLIGFAFDVLGAHYLDVRVVPGSGRTLAAAYA